MREEIPNVISAITTRTRAASRYVPIKFVFTNRLPTAATTTIPTSRHVTDVALCACEKSHQMPTPKPPISHSSLRLHALRSIWRTCSRYQKKK